MSTAGVCRKHGVSTATFYKYKARFGGLEVSDARPLKALEGETAKLKKLLAEAMLDHAMQNGFVESFNGRFRDEFLNERLFSSLADARDQSRAWQHDDNHHRSHSGLGNIPPVEFVAKKGLAMRAA